jgi:hypothetical protein
VPLDSSSKRRSSVGLLSLWQTAPPSPGDTPTVIDQADRAHIAGAYSGIAAAESSENGHSVVLRPQVRRSRAIKASGSLAGI